MDKLRKKDLDMTTFLECYDRHNRINKENNELLNSLFVYKESIKEQFNAPALLGKINQYFFKHRSPQNIEYWLERGWDEKNAFLKVETQNNIQARSKRWYIDKFGEIEGLKEYEKMTRNMSYKTRLFFNFPHDVARQKYDEYLLTFKNQNTLDWCISKYGEVQGQEKYKNRINKLKSYNYKQSIISKHGQVHYDTINNKRTNTLKRQYSENPNSRQFRGLSTYYNISGVSNKLFDSIVCSVDLCDFAYFGNNEQIIVIKSDTLTSEYIKPDFLCGNKIIEFYGSYWHKDPRFYDDRIEHIEKRKHDSDRISALSELGYSVKIVWEFDYKTYPKKIIAECIDFLNNNV